MFEKGCKSVLPGLKNDTLTFDYFTKRYSLNWISNLQLEWTVIATERQIGMLNADARKGKNQLTDFIYLFPSPPVYILDVFQSGS